MKHHRLITCCLPLVFLLTACVAEQSEQPQAVSAEMLKQNETDMLSYSYGYLIGQRAGTAIDEIDFAVFSRGLYDAIESGTPTVSNETMMKAIEAYGEKRQAAERAKQAEMTAANLAQSEEFLREFETKDGVKSLDNGVLYRVIEQGNGKSPTEKSTVKVHYKGALIDGNVFDSSYDRNEPVEFGLGDVIEGWQVALSAMKVGDKWEVALPPAVAYGENGVSDAIPPNSALVFEIELLDVKNAK